MNDSKDKEIIKLFFARDESAIAQTQAKYRGFCLSVVSNFLEFDEDREECINDSMLELWNSIPPEDPDSLSAYLAEILRNNAIQKSRRENAWKRGGRVLTVGEEFLSDLSDGRTLADDYESALAGKILNGFLQSQPREIRRIFILRYWFDEDIADISARTGRSVSNIKSLLKRLRDKLRAELKKEGIIYE